MINTSKEMGLQYLIDAIEKEIIQASLVENNQSIRKTMSALKISQSKVYKFKDDHDKK
jgi:DNA-binding NtrC family response regulator